jgi:hypothetical protein
MSPAPLEFMTLGGGPGGIFLDVPGISIIHRRRVFFGRRMNRNIGKYFRNRILIQFGIEWVRGPLKNLHNVFIRLVFVLTFT